jgi:acetolactate decarboxylase
MKKLFILYCLLVFTSCGNIVTTSKSIEKVSVEVQYFGALRNMMRDSDISAKVDLAEFSKKKHLYALGAIENLKGEIQIFDGKPFNTYAKNNQVEFDYSFEKKATLLVASIVEEWVEISIPDSIKSYDELELFIESTASLNHINTEEPFPFLLEGNVASMGWHVIDWEDGDTEHSCEKHKTKGPNGQLENVDAEMIGFYSKHHHTIFTHHSTNMHIHMKSDELMLAGHVDHLTIADDMVLHLPLILNK